MGVTRTRPANQVQLVRSVDGKPPSLTPRKRPRWFNDGNPHRFAVERQGDQWAFTLDGTQFSVPLATGKPWDSRSPGVRY